MDKNGPLPDKIEVPMRGLCSAIDEKTAWKMMREYLNSYTSKRPREKSAK